MSEGWVRVPFLEYKNRGYFPLGLYTIYGISYLNLGFPSGLFPVVVDKESRLYPFYHEESPVSIRFAGQSNMTPGFISAGERQRMP